MYSAKKTQDYFNNKADNFSEAKAPRDEIFLNLILNEYQNNNGEITALDFGCGGGKLLLSMLDMGINAKGIEKHDNIYKLARERLSKAGYNKSKIIQGSIKELALLPPASFDFIVVMGVFQYLSPKDYHELLNTIYTLLKPSGHLVASFQNALFDIFTFNKYTVDFYEEKFFKPLGLDKLFGDDIVKDLKSLISNPEKPDYSHEIARDNIYVRTTNPLTIADELSENSFNLLQKYFYNFFFVPRLIEVNYKDKLKKLKEEFEVNRSTEWFGNFMANAFVVDCIKRQSKINEK